MWATPKELSKGLWISRRLIQAKVENLFRRESTTAVTLAGRIPVALTIWDREMDSPLIRLRMWRLSASRKKIRLEPDV